MLVDQLIGHFGAFAGPLAEKGEGGGALFADLGFFIAERRDILIGAGCGGDGIAHFQRLVHAVCGRRLLVAEEGKHHQYRREEHACLDQKPHRFGPPVLWLVVPRDLYAPSCRLPFCLPVLVLPVPVLNTLLTPGSECRFDAGVAIFRKFA